MKGEKECENGKTLAAGEGEELHRAQALRGDAIVGRSGIGGQLLVSLASEQKVQFSAVHGKDYEER